MKKLYALFFICILFSTKAQLPSLGSYVWTATIAPKDFNGKLQLSFVRPNDGFPSYGSVLAGGGYYNGQDGGVFQLYFPYGESYDGNSPKIRLGKYDNQGWSNWETFYTSANANKGSIDWTSRNLLVSNYIGIGTITPISKLDLGSNYSDPGIYPNKITLWSGGSNNYFGFGISNATLDYFSQHNHRFFVGYNGNPGKEAMIINTHGNVGIGTSLPLNKLQVWDPTIDANAYPLKVSSGDGSFAPNQELGIDFAQYNTSVARISMNYFSPDWGLNFYGYQNALNSNPIITFRGSGNVGIGTTNPQNKLDVNGVVHAKEVKVDLNGWADFVFKKDYPLPTLEQVEKHISEKGHLPNIPSEKEVLEKGLSIGESQRLLLQKIEELTLYIIEQDKKIRKLEKKILQTKN